MLRAGNLRHRVTVQEPTETRNAYGEPEVTWDTFAHQIWAAVEPLRGREFWAGKELQARVTTRIRIRYLAGVTPKMRVVHGDKTYLIDSVIDEEERHIAMQLMCEEWVET